MGADDVPPDHTAAGAAPMSETEAQAQTDADTATAAAALHKDGDHHALPPSLAYSDVAEDASDEANEHLETRETASAVSRYALAILLFIVTAGAVVVTAGLLMSQLDKRDSHAQSLPPAGTTSATQTVTPAEDQPAPALSDPARWNSVLEAIAQHQTLADADAAYLSALYSAGLVITTPERAIDSGHSVCSYLAQGHAPSDAIMHDMEISPTMTTANARDFIYAAINAYCPQYR